MGKGGKIRAKRPSRFFYLLLRENDGMINKEFFAALEDLEAEKGIKKEVFIEALENALAAAITFKIDFRKDIEK